MLGSFLWYLVKILQYFVAETILVIFFYNLIAIFAFSNFNPRRGTETDVTFNAFPSATFWRPPDTIFVLHATLSIQYSIGLN